MLKRSQILLADWQLSFIKEVAEYYDLSISEIVRILVSEAIISISFSVLPEKKQATEKKVSDELKKKFMSYIPVVERHKLISKLYFEARKTSEALSEARTKRKT